jgi:hypothetical protein
MKRCFLAGLVFLALAGSGRAGEEKFSQSIKADDFSAAGLNHLSPAELSRLDALVAAYKNGVIADARRSADEALSAKRAAEAEAKAAKAEVAESKKSSQGFLAKAKVMVVPGTKIEYAMVKSTIPGKFRGWENHTVFVLANGQRWQVVNGDRYFTPTKENIEVEITPSVLGGYWMNFPVLGTQVRVKLLYDK